MIIRSHAVIFNLCGTLVTPGHSALAHEWLARELEVPTQLLEEAINSIQVNAEVGAFDSKHSASVIWQSLSWMQAVYTALEITVPGHERLAMLVRRYQELWVPTVEFYPGVEDALATLRAKTNVGICFNDAAIHGVPVVQALGLEWRVHQVLGSYATGMRKPGEAIYRYACQLFGVPASSVVWVDDDPVHATTALQMGMRVMMPMHAGTPAALSPLVAELIGSVGVEQVDSIDEVFSRLDLD